MLAKTQFDSIETLVSQALIDMEISHEEFNAIIREKQKYERMKENLRNVGKRSSSKKQENKIEQCEFKKNIEFVTDDFNWLKDV